jgi:hypothetical protein
MSISYTTLGTSFYFRNEMLITRRPVNLFPRFLAQIVANREISLLKTPKRHQQIKKLQTNPKNENGRANFGADNLNFIKKIPNKKKRRADLEADNLNINATKYINI